MPPVIPDDEYMAKNGDRFLTKALGDAYGLHKKTEDDKQEKSKIRATCNYCGRASSTGKLSTCARCRSVRYCNTDCQIAHFRASHKLDCRNFTYPPITSLFDTRTRPGMQYPLTPVLGIGFGDGGVGCWVSAGTRIDCRLQTSLCRTLGRPDRKFLIHDQEKAILIGKGKGLLNNLLTLRVLVQNRRKDRSQILIHGAMSHIIGAANAGEYLQRCQVSESIQLPRMNVFPGMTCPYLSVYMDPWGGRHASVLSVNGVEYTGNFDRSRSNNTSSTPPLDQIKRPKDAILTLGHGDYAVIELQFLCGDGAGIWFDFEALNLFHAIGIPYMKWDGLEDIDAAIGRMLDVETPDRVSMLSAFFIPSAINSYYADFKRDGPEAHIRSHYGDRAAEISEGDNISDAVHDWMINEIKTDLSEAELQMMKNKMEQMGAHNVVNWLENELSQG